MRTQNRKILFYIFFFLMAGTSLIAQPKIGFSKESHDFGLVKEGDIASYEFKFVNTGDQPLVISSVKASCGCTTPFWTKNPFLQEKKA